MPRKTYTNSILDEVQSDDVSSVNTLPTLQCLIRSALLDRNIQFHIRSQKHMGYVTPLFRADEVRTVDRTKVTMERPSR